MEKEKIIQNIIKSKEFSEILSNSRLLKKAERNELPKKGMNSEEEIKNNNNNNNCFCDHERERKIKMNYLRKIAFENRKDYDSESESIFEEQKKMWKKDNRDPWNEREDQIKVDGKIFYLKVILLNLIT